MNRNSGRWVSLFVLCLSGLAAAQPRPFVVFVRGFQPADTGTFAPLGMAPVRDYLRGLDAETMSVTWNCFRDGAAQDDCALNDAQFLQDLGNRINALPLQRPVILIGHSYGGDSLLKAVNGANGISRKINRPITALITLDPVSTGGNRLTQSPFYEPVPNTVQVFFNRWQRQTAPPVNFLNDGAVRCSSPSCDQTEAPIQRRCDSSAVTNVYQPPTPPCPSWVPRSLCPGAPPAIVTDRLSNHGSLVDDAFINRQIIETLHKVLSPRRAVTFLNHAKNRFVTAEGGGGPNTGSVTVNRTAAGTWERFDVIDLNGGNLLSGDKVALASFNGFFVSSQSDTSVVADRTAIGRWETFTFLQANGGAAAAGALAYLVDDWGWYLSASPSSTLVAVESTGCLTSGYGCAFVIGGKVSNAATPAPICR